MTAARVKAAKESAAAAAVKATAAAEVKATAVKATAVASSAREQFSNRRHVYVFHTVINYFGNINGCS